MHRKFTIFISLLFLISSTELHEFARLPRLFLHYIHHQQEDPSLTLGDFIELHYRINHPVDNDDSEDQQLPFKSGTVNTQSDITNSLWLGSVTLMYVFQVDTLPAWYAEGVPQHRAYAIFHPPRAAFILS
ncbi:MAG: hypothetical protein NTW29_06090 [Bacteroidetes bacterium]|nr:hypothetical protein [Bacteroidota bacterium]